MLAASVGRAVDVWLQDVHQAPEKILGRGRGLLVVSKEYKSGSLQLL